MMRRVAATVLFVAGIAAAAAAPSVARHLRGDGSDRCDLDGSAIDPAARVRIVDEQSVSHRFCGVHCAERWIEKSGERVREILVTDEASGNEVDARGAWFVWMRAPGESGIRAFADEREARRHAAAFGSTVLTGDERPFRGKE
jgi:hypothetical protein